MDIIFYIILGHIGHIFPPSPLILQFKVINQCYFLGSILNFVKNDPLKVFSFKTNIQISKNFSIYNINIDECYKVDTVDFSNFSTAYNKYVRTKFLLKHLSFFPQCTKRHLMLGDKTLRRINETITDTSYDNRTLSYQL